MMKIVIQSRLDFYELRLPRSQKIFKKESTKYINKQKNETQSKQAELNGKKEQKKSLKMATAKIAVTVMCGNGKTLIFLFWNPLDWYWWPPSREEALHTKQSSTFCDDFITHQWPVFHEHLQQVSQKFFVNLYIYIFFI